MTELAAAIARADGGCSCRSSTVPCAMHPDRETSIQQPRGLVSTATAFDVVQAEIMRAYREIGGRP